MKLSVVIPTYNRVEILTQCIEALLVQDYPNDKFEIIIVDDGSIDNTRSVIANMKKKFAGLKYIWQENQGQGVARNTGVSLASGEIVIFIGDDIIVKNDFISEHARFHLRYQGLKEAVLGLTVWHPQMKVTDLMSWLTNGSSIFGKFGGHQFAYEKLAGKTEADFNFFYTSNISLKRALLRDFPFDPKFSGYGWEDIELGYRLQKKCGLKIFYNSEAIGFHFHEINEEGMCARMRHIGRSAWIIHEKYPELQKVPSLFKQIIFVLLSNPLSLLLFRWLRDITQGKFCSLYYYAISKKCFMEGIQSVNK